MHLTTAVRDPLKAGPMRRGFVPAVVGIVLACSAALWSLPVQAQSDDEGTEAVVEEFDTNATKLTAEEAASVLALALPDAPDARYALLQRQFRAAKLVNDRARTVAIAYDLVEAGRGQPDGESWIKLYLNAEFTWGSSGKALQACEAFIEDPRLSLVTRATVALRQTYFSAQSNNRLVMMRYWSRAQDLVKQAVKSGDLASRRLPMEHLQVRAEVERWQGDLAASVATLRESVGVGRRELEAARASTNPAKDFAVVDAYGWLDGSLGMLTYALVRNGRAAEAVEVSQANLALWRAGQITDSLGARWNYRLAMSLNATQEYEAGLVAARTADDMLQRTGASAASHTRWLARHELVRALIGLKRWKEADASYREFLAEMPPDVLARTRASDNRLLALLAVKSGRQAEALEIAERSHRTRNRLFGANHPLTQEAAGVRAVVRLLRGEIKLAMDDYEALFSATLDNPGGWRDLDMRGMRGFVFGIAFDEFMRYVAERAIKGEPVEPALADRALQIADRSSLGVTQRALTDSTARVLASTPKLRDLLEQEQAQRQAVAGLFSKLNGTLGQEDKLRRETQTDTFKALPAEKRKTHSELIQAVRQTIKTQQAEVSAARVVLATQRENIAKQFPAYADLVTPATPKPEQLRALLGAGEALLVIHPTESATLVWLIDAEGKNIFSASKLTTAELSLRVAELRTMLDIGSAPLGAEPVLRADQLYALYRDLFAPLDGALREVRSLIVATSGPLASVPLAALITRPIESNKAPDWLLRQMAVTQLPSSSALQALRRVAAQRAAPKAMMGFGDPLFKLATQKGVGKVAPMPVSVAGVNRVIGSNLTAEATRYDAQWGFRYADVPPLPESRAELQAVAKAVGADAKTDLLFGDKATRRAVLGANLQDRRVVAFATHGLMPGELPGISKPSLAMAATSDANESPLLELDDVLGLRLNAQWVLLSACNTAAGEQGGGAMSGLVRGFFFAGARSVLATHWAVESDSAAALTGATFKAQAKGSTSRGESLRQAQLAMVDGSLGSGKWIHPFYWAPYALFGDPAR